MKLDKLILDKIENDYEKCVDCKRCFTNCPMMKKFGSSPKEIMGNLDNGIVDVADIAYSCMLCDLCTLKCPKDIDLKDTFYKLRKEVFVKDARSLKQKGYTTVKVHQINSFSSVFTKSSNLNDSKVLFLPGCSLSSYNKELVNNAYEYLKLHYYNISLTFNCCGKPTLAMGDTVKFEKYYSKLDGIIEKNNIEEIIVACPNCYNTIKKNSKNVKITSIYEVINKFGVPKYLIKYYEKFSLDFAVHDSCSVRGESEIHESTRSILKNIGINIIEFKNNKENTVCCGAGGMVGVTNRELAVEQMKKRGHETSCDNIACYCQSCCDSMLNANKNVLHILDFLFNEEVIQNNTLTQSKVGTLEKWKMRYKSVGIVKK